MSTSKHPQVVIVATELPARVGGAPVRNLGLIQQLTQHNYNVLVVCLSDELHSPTELNRLGIHPTVIKLRSLGIMQKLFGVIKHRVPPSYLGYRDDRMLNALLKLAETADQPIIFQIEQLQGYFAIEPIAAQLIAAGHHLVLDAHNVEWVAFREGTQTLSLAKRLLGRWIAGGMKQRETAAAKLAHQVLVCSQVDQAFFESLNQAVFVIPNGVDCKHFSPKPVADLSPMILFVGSAGYPPNNDALRFYVTAVHPQVISVVPQAKFVAVGDRPPAWLTEKARHDSSLQIAGFVPDVRDAIVDATVCICPIRAGSGTRLKVLEYLGSGKPIVATQKGIEGIDYAANKHVLIANTASDFAKQIIAILTNPKLSAELGNNARQLALEKYDWKRIGELLDNAFGLLDRNSR